jgi:hypothetical protein
MADVYFLLGGIPMDQIKALLDSVNFDSNTFIKAAVILAVSTIVLGFIGRFVFGKRSALNHSVSSAICILFVYAATVVLYSLGARYQKFIAPLPFVSFSGTKMTLFSFSGSDYTIICSELLSMIILAFLANLFEGILPKGKRFLGWLFYRCLGIVLAMAAHLVVTWLFNTYLPQGLVIYAPTVLLAILVLMLLLGGLKVIVGAVLATVNPVIGALYTLFFATIVGKAISKAVLTTAILAGIIAALNYIGVFAVSIASAALIAYIPFLIVLVVIWYVVAKVL